MKKLLNYQELKERLSNEASRLKSQLAEGLDSADIALQRARGKRMHVGVAGMSHSGKSSFITGLVAQLEAGDASELTGFCAALEGRIMDVEVLSADAAVPFAYEEQKQRFANGKYPRSTTEAAELRLKISYCKRSGKESTLELIISDFPGEWLMDVALLSMSYEEWNTWQCALWRADAERFGVLDVFQHDEIASTLTLAEILNAQLRKFIAKRRNEQALSINTPGRIAITGAEVAEDAIPLPCFDWRAGEDEVLDQFLIERYERYKKEYVEAFFEHCIKPIDRQLVLLDVHSISHDGEAALQRIKQALQLVMGQVNYGEASSVSRLFGAKVDRVLFVATKSDLVLPEDHHAMQSLLRTVVDPTINDIKRQRSAVAIQTAAAMVATQYVRHSGELYLEAVTEDGRCLRFRNPALMREEGINYAEQQSWELPRLSPLRRSELPGHQRLDQVLETLLGDYLQ